MFRSLRCLCSSLSFRTFCDGGKPKPAYPSNRLRQRRPRTWTSSLSKSPKATASGKKWTGIGGAFPHKDGIGFSIELKAFPMDGRPVATAGRQRRSIQQIGHAPPSSGPPGPFFVAFPAPARASAVQSCWAVLPSPETAGIK